jgi:hypothetical protein
MLVQLDFVLSVIFNLCFSWHWGVIGSEIIWYFTITTI